MSLPAVCPRARRKRNEPQPVCPRLVGQTGVTPEPTALAAGTAGPAGLKGDPAMNAREKRALFRKDFGEHLLPQGFTFRENAFLRAHADALLVVRLDLAPSGNGYVEYGALAACDGIRWPLSDLARVAVLKGRRWQDILSSSPELQALEERRARLAEEYLRARREVVDGETGEGHGQAEVLRARREVDYLCAHHAQLYSFLADVLPRLARVADTRGALDFHEWETAFYGAAPASLTLECVAVGCYDRALFHARRILERWTQSERNVREDMERTGKASQRLETLQRAALEKRREKMRRWQTAVDDLEQGNYERLHARIAENEAVSRATLAALGLG